MCKKSFTEKINLYLLILPFLITSFLELNFFVYKFVNTLTVASDFHVSL